MQIATQTNTITSNVVSDRTNFTITNSPHAFKVLSKQLYSDPIRACIRELCCNAIDAHTAAGKPDEPIAVHLPSQLEPWFAVTDHGTGLSFEDVESLYTTYFGSTKRGSDDQIGGFGLGSKSPFAYTDSFTVDARWNGNKRSYVAYIDPDGKPAIQAMTPPMPTDEDNGLTVKFAVKPSDIQRFAIIATDVCQWFDVWPKGNVPAAEVNKIAMEGDGWVVLERRYGSIGSVKVVQGGVAYAVNVTDIDGISDVAVSVFLNYYTIVLRVPIGTVTPAPSREQLSYDTATCINLVRAAEGAYRDIQEYYRDRLKGCDNYYDACVTWYNGMQRLPFADLITPTYKGRELDDSIELVLGTGKFAIVDTKAILDSGAHGRAVEYKKGHISYWSAHKGTLVQSFYPHAYGFLWLETVNFKTWKRLKLYADACGQPQWYVFIGPKSEWLSHWEAIGNPKYITEADLPVVPKAAPKPKEMVKPYRLRNVSGGKLSGRGVTHNLLKQDVDLSVGGYYTKIDQWSPAADSDFTLIESGVSAGVISVADFYIVPKSMWKKFDEASNWSRIEDKIKSKITPAKVKKYLRMGKRYRESVAVTRSRAFENWSRLKNELSADALHILEGRHPVFLQLKRLGFHADDIRKDYTYNLRMITLAESIYGKSRSRDIYWDARWQDQFASRYPLLARVLGGVMYYDQLTDAQQSDIVSYLIAKG
jgi:hypothetical protein